jgi:hypothetical protein
MGIKSLVQVVIMIAMMAFMNGQLPAIHKQVQIAKIFLLNSSKGSTWGRVMIP